MAVTKQTYTSVATWTAGSLADIFRSAFIGAGLMVDWHDSFLSGSVDNRVLRIVNDNTKTYGTVFYWFMFTTTGAFVHTALSWDTVAHVPTGSAYLDYFATTTSVTTNHYGIATLVNTTDVSITRYTSGINSSATFFLLRNGNTYAPFFIGTPGFNANSSINQNIVAFNPFIVPTVSTSSQATLIVFNQATSLRRTYLGAAGLRARTSSGDFRALFPLMTYSGIGNETFGSYASYANPLVTAMTNTQTGIASDYVPIYTSFIMSTYMNPLPADFGLTVYYASNLMSGQDVLVVNPGVEEWEMIGIASNGNSNAGRILLLARIL